MKSITRGDVYYADLTPVVGSEQGGVRPVLIVQNNKGNMYSPTVIVCAITSVVDKNWLPTHVELNEVVERNSIILLEQLRTIDRQRLMNYIGHCSENVMANVDRALRVSLEL